MSSRRSARLSAISLAQKYEEKLQPLAIAPSEKRKGFSEFTPAEAPSTPKRQRISTKPTVPSITLTPSAIGLMTVPYSSGDIDDMSPPRVDRLAVLNRTNATLVTPETHRIVANKPLDQVSPSKVSNIKITTGNILDEALAHIVKVEPRLRPVVEKHHCHVFSLEGLSEEIDPFRSLVSGIISQQVSGPAAKSIKAKFVALFNPTVGDATLHSFPTPSQVVTKPVEALRTAGLSQRKAEYVLGLAEKFHSGEITTSMLFSASYEEVFEELIKVRGLGRWSIEMFACFGLKRIDVFSTGDLGVQRGMAALSGRDVAKLKNGGKGRWKYMSEKDMIEMSDRFKPYRSVFMWYMWRVEDVDISTFES